MFSAILCLTISLWAQTLWQHLKSPGFDIYHESSRPPSTLALDLERIHGKLKLHMSLFAPWLGKEKIKYYLHKDSASYSQSEFEPPPWSNGIALPQKRTIVMFEQPKNKLLQVTAHEMSHLLLEGFFKEKDTKVPAWLNEGLAMLMEDLASSQPSQESIWYQAMKNLNTKDLDIAKLMRAEPDKNASHQSVETWYIQSYSLVRFLYTEKPKLQFRNFCERLRNKQEFKQALWLAYRWSDSKKLELAWSAWLKKQSNALK